jgi:catechol 2,3-dioxygenase-like lactoylglutathione lyase family enzyme
MRKILVLLSLLCLVSAAHAEGLVGRVGPIGMTVSDMDRSIAFYSTVLGFERMSDVEVTGGEAERLQGVFGLTMRVVRLRLGGEEIELTEYLAPRGRPIPADSRSHDGWFQHVAIVVRDMDHAYAWLRRHRVTHASPGPQRLPDWNPDAGGIRAFYFKDPDDHVLEVIWFPPGKGDVRWQRPGDALFLGIDHTAIVVADTARSLRFYQDVLGLVVAGGSENHGPEQERLNNVFGARLRITTLRAPAGPGIELLEYLAPGDGRAMPVDVRANDLVHWQVRLTTEDPAVAEQRVRAARAWLVSPGAVSLSERPLGFRRGLLVRDPDGHAVQLTGE